MASSLDSSASSGGRSGPPPRADPSTQCRSNCLHKKAPSFQLPAPSGKLEAGGWKHSFLSLTELEPFARSLLAVLLALLDARVARQESSLLEPLPQFDVVLDQRPRDPES